MTTDAPIEIADRDLAPDDGGRAAAESAGASEALMVAQAVVATARGPLQVLVLPDGTIVAAQTHITAIGPAGASLAGDDINARIAAMLAQIVPLASGGAWADDAAAREPSQPARTPDDQLMRSVQRIIEMVNGGGTAQAEPSAIDMSAPGRLNRINPSAGRLAGGPVIEHDAAPGGLRARFAARFVQSRFDADSRARATADALAIGLAPAGATTDPRHLLQRMAGTAAAGSERIASLNAIGLWGLATLSDHPVPAMRLGAPTPPADDIAAAGGQHSGAAAAHAVAVNVGHAAAAVLHDDAPLAAVDANGHDGGDATATVADPTHDASSRQAWTAPAASGESHGSDTPGAPPLVGVTVLASVDAPAWAEGASAAGSAHRGSDAGLLAADPLAAPTTLDAAPPAAGVEDSFTGTLLAAAGGAPALPGSADAAAEVANAIAGDAAPTLDDAGPASTVGEVVGIVAGDASALGEIITSLLADGDAASAVGDVATIVGGDASAIGDLVPSLLGDGGTAAGSMVGAAASTVADAGNGLGIIAAALLGTADGEGDRGLHLGSALATASEELGTHGVAALVEALGAGAGHTSLALASVLDTADGSAIPAALGTAHGASASQGASPQAAGNVVDALVHQLAPGLLNGGHA